jgi:hypothetical protein
MFFLLQIHVLVFRDEFFKLFFKKNVDIMIMTLMNYYYFQFCGVVQMTINDKNI